MPKSSRTKSTKRKSAAAKHVAPRHATLSPEMRRVLTLAIFAASRAFLETWEKESPKTMPEAMQLMHDVLARHALKD